MFDIYNRKALKAGLLNAINLRSRERPRSVWDGISAQASVIKGKAALRSWAFFPWSPCRLIQRLNSTPSWSVRQPGTPKIPWPFRMRWRSFDDGFGDYNIFRYPCHRAISQNSPYGASTLTRRPVLPTLSRVQWIKPGKLFIGYL